MRSPIRKPDKNVLRKLTQRELSRKGNRSFDRSSAQEKFRGFELCVRTLYLLYLWAWAVSCGVLRTLHLCLRASLFASSPFTSPHPAEWHARHAWSQGVTPTSLIFEETLENHWNRRRQGSQSTPIFASGQSLTWWAVQDIIFALAASGVCVAFRRGTKGIYF